jgi:hypothetical protein
MRVTARSGEVEFGAVGDPGARMRVIFVVEGGALPPSWGTAPVDFSSIRLSSGEAKFMRRAAWSSDEGADVEDGIVAAEGEFEAVLAVLGPVACAGGAAQFASTGFTSRMKSTLAFGS